MKSAKAKAEPFAKANAIESERRVTEIYGLLLQRETRQNILQFAAETWGIESRQTAAYIAKARAQMKQEAKAARSTQFAEHIALRRDLYQKAVRKGSWFTALQVAQDEARLLGLYYTIEDHLEAVLKAGYIVYEPNTPEALAADQAIASADFDCEVEICATSEAT